MFGVLFKALFILLGGFAVCFALGQALRNARRLDRRIAEFKAEQKELEEQGRIVHPYAAMAELYTEDEPQKQKRR